MRHTYKAIALTVALMLMSVPVMAEEKPDAPRYELSVALFPERGEMRGGVGIFLPETGAATGYHVQLGQTHVFSATLNGRKIKLDIKDNVLSVKGGGELKILFGATFKAPPRPDGPDNSGVVSGNSITNSGVFLMQGWYPRMSGPGLYTLNVFLPERLVPVSEADEVEYTELKDGRRYDMRLNTPVDGLTLMAAEYEVMREQAGEVEVSAYFFKEDRELGRQYLRRTIDYIKMYTEMLGEFPYKRFSVVESPQPTGYSMPTYTLIGQGILRLPFILETSLGHEVLHQWYGNSVRVKSDEEHGYGGNWAEALTAYMADHHYDELKGEGASHRKRLLMDYRNYVKPDSETALMDFSSRVDLQSRAIGYAKGAMVFHMLRGEVGDEAFMEGLRLLYTRHAYSGAGWDDIRRVFDEVSGRELDWFFDQWIRRKGKLTFSVEAARPMFINGSDMVYFELVQQGSSDNKGEFILPVKVITWSGEEEFKVRIESQRQPVELRVGARPSELVLDAGYDLMRSLEPVEAAPTISALTGSDTGVFVLPDSGGDKYAPAASVFEARGYRIVNDSQLSFKDMASAPVVVASGASGTLRGLFAGEPALIPDIMSPVVVAPGAGFYFEVMENPLSLTLPLAIVYTRDEAEAEAASRKISRYGRYSRLGFESGRNTLKETARSQSGMRVRLGPEVTGVRVRRAMGLREIIGEIIHEADRKPVIYVGEAHTSYEHHKVQLEFVRTLEESGADLAIGMEMFQTPFQNALDDYLAGHIDEDSFLRQSEYFTRWSYNYHLYREILQYARANNIPVVALNQKNEIVRKVSVTGPDSLGEDEKALLPPDMDLSDAGYRERLREVFEAHSGGREFSNFYFAQVLWDETMAHSIAEHLRANPGRRMVVIAGQGHMVWRSGIPERVKRLTGLDYSLVIQNEEGVLGPEKADYVLYTEAMPAPGFPLIGVKTGQAEGGILIEGLLTGGAAERAGMREGDIITHADGLETKGIEDLRLALYKKKHGEGITLKARRERFILSPREMEFRLTLR